MSHAHWLVLLWLGACADGRTVEHVLVLERTTCESCAQAIEAALAAVPGVSKASASHAERRARVTARATLKPETLIEAVSKLGYGARLLR